MAKTEMICAHVEPDLKQEAEEVFSRLGPSSTEAITLFYRQVALQRGLPFEVKTPNAETCEALREVHSREGLTEYTDLDQFRAKDEQAMREGACEETDLARTNGAFWSAGVQLARNPILGRVIHIPRNQRSPDVGGR